MKSALGDENKKVPLKQGAVGPEAFPEMHEFEDPHHPHDPWCKQASSLLDHWLQLTTLILNFLDPS